jgi:hypothetical protein
VEIFLRMLPGIEDSKKVHVARRSDHCRPSVGACQKRRLQPKGCR